MKNVSLKPLNIKVHHFLRKRISLFSGIIVRKVSKYGVFSGPHFPAFGLNTERYGISLRIHCEWGKILTRKNTRIWILFTHWMYFMLECFVTVIVGVIFVGLLLLHCTKNKVFHFSFFNKCGQIRSFLWIWSHLLKKSTTENFIFCAMLV